MLEGQKLYAEGAPVLLNGAESRVGSNPRYPRPLASSYYSILYPPGDGGSGSILDTILAGGES